MTSADEYSWQPRSPDALMQVRRFAVPMFCAVGVLLNLWLACNLFLPGAWHGRNDFLGFYAGAKLVGTPRLYSRDATREVQLESAGQTGEIQYGRLPCYALFLKPLGALPYHTAYVLWVVLQASAFAGFIALWPGGTAVRRWIVCCWCLPAFICLFNGQDDLLLLLWAALALRQLRVGRPIAAGMLLALCASKFHLFGLVPSVILAQRRWRMAGGLALGGCGLLALSFAAAGSTWPVHYWAVLADQRMSTGLAHMPNLHSLLDFGQFGLPIQGAVSVLIAVTLFLVARRTCDFEAPFAVALIAGILLGFHSYLADTVLFLPALIAFCRGTKAWVAATVLLTPVPYVLLQLQTPLPALTQTLVLLFASVCLLSIARAGSEPKLSEREPHQSLPPVIARS